MRYGSVGHDPMTGRMERFEPGALKPHGDQYLDLEHRSGLRVATLNLGNLRMLPRTDRLDLEADVSPTVANIVRSERMHGLSVEFVAREEYRSGGVRVIAEALHLGTAATSRPAYTEALLELRRGSFVTRVFRSYIPRYRAASCACSGDDCGYASFTDSALNDIANKIKNDDVVAAFGRYDRPLASSSTGRIRADMGDDGLHVTIDLPDTGTAEELAIAATTTGVVMRPFLDPDDIDAVSEVIEDNGRRVREWHDGTSTRALIVAATDQKEGWPVPTIEDVEPRSARVSAPAAVCDADVALRRSERRRRPLWTL